MSLPYSHRHLALLFARLLSVVSLATAALHLPSHAAEPTKAGAPDFLAIARGYADAMIDHSRENLPDPKLPLFPIVLTRDTYHIPAGKVGNLVTARVPQEFKNIANSHHDLNLYQFLLRAHHHHR